MLLGMTHEEAVVHLARSELNSYKQLPFMLYQIQTKYRDEARPRAGLIRVREFTMKDAYSFHASEECLKTYYERVHQAYSRIFKRIGFKKVAVIESDTGMMGGAASHEFMALADCGEDTIFSCDECDYRANREVARSSLSFRSEVSPTELEKISTPGTKTIEQLAGFLKITPSQTGKAVFYTDGQKVFLAMIRGDLEVNETKLRNALKLSELKPATDEQIRAVGSMPGFASPLGIDFTKVDVVCDPSVSKSTNLVVGANEADHHYQGFNFNRELASHLSQIRVVDIAAVREGDPCPGCGHALKQQRGIEIGNIFQLGTRYSESMKCSYLDQNGKSRHPLMGCYGIGVGRAMASVMEQSHDEYGPIWPKEIAPYQVHLCALNFNDVAVKEASEKLYQDLLNQGIEALFDDRNEKAGAVFNDADLIGVPIRIIVSPKTLSTQSVEIKTRDKSTLKMIPLTEAVQCVKELL